MKILIIANGELYKFKILKSRIRATTFDLVIAANGGANYASNLGVTLDVIIGDMDSVSDLGFQRKTHIKLVNYPSEKEETDLELALLYAKSKRANKIVIVGVMGGRMDMTISNILLVTHLSLELCIIELWHGEQTGWIIKPPGGEISGYLGDMVSLIPILGCTSAITTKGLKYPLKHEELKAESTRGISNVMDKPSVSIDLSKGLLLVVHTPINGRER
jgi:thiamine pyrophosphokinase